MQPFGEISQTLRRYSHHLADLTDYPSGAKGANSGYRRNMLLTVFPGEIKPNIIAPLGFKVDVDVWSFTSISRKKTIKEEVMLEGVDPRTAQAVGHH